MISWLIRLYLIILLITCLAVDAIASGGRNAEQSKITVVDAAGRNLELNLPANRVAVHYPYILEIMQALDAADKVVAVPDNVLMFGKLFERFADAIKIGQGAGPGSKINMEALLKAQPELIFVHPGTANQLNLQERLRPFNIPVVAVDVTSLDTLERNIQIIAKILGKEKEASRLIKLINSNLKIVDERVKKISSDKRVRVYPEFFTDFYICIKGFTGDPIVTRAGGINIGRDLAANIVSSEWVIKENPDVILKTQLPYLMPSGLDVKKSQGMETLRKQIMERSAWDKIKAVKDGKVYIINSDLWAGPRVWLGTIYTVKALYPDRFKDIDPEKIHKEYLSNFMNIKDDGIWFWPKP